MRITPRLRRAAAARRATAQYGTKVARVPAVRAQGAAGRARFRRGRHV